MLLPYWQYNEWIGAITFEEEKYQGGSLHIIITKISKRETTAKVQVQSYYHIYIYITGNRTC